MAHSVKDELEYLIKSLQRVGKTEFDTPMLKTLIRTKGVIVTLENRLEGKLTARDQIALAMLPGTAGIDDPGLAMAAAFKAADLFIEASKETDNG